MGKDLRKTNRLWFQPVESLSMEDLELLQYAFSVGFVPLGNRFAPSNPEWVSWELDVLQRINQELGDKGREIGNE